MAGGYVDQYYHHDVLPPHHRGAGRGERPESEGNRRSLRRDEADGARGDPVAVRDRRD